MVDDVETSEEPSHVVADHLLEGNKPVPVFEGDEPRHVAGNLDPGELHLVAVGVTQQDRQVERQVGDERERVRRVDRQRSEDWEDLGLEHEVDVIAVPCLECVVGDDLDLFLGERRDELLGHQGVDAGVDRDDPFPDGCQLLLRAHPVRGGLGDPAGRLLEEAGDAYLIELVEVAGHDRHEPHPFQQGPISGFGEAEHAFLEVEKR